MCLNVFIISFYLIYSREQMMRADRLYKKVSAQLRAEIIGRYAYYFNQD